MDPLIAKDLELRLIGEIEHRLMWMGIGGTTIDYPPMVMDVWLKQSAFARQLLTPQGARRAGRAARPRQD